MKKVLVTGGIGFIGSHTCVELLSQNYEVIVIDNLSNSQIWIKDKIEEISGKNITFYSNDVCDRNALIHIFETEKNIDSIIHFAAYKAVGESVEFPLKYYKNNIDSLLNLIEIAEKFQCKKMVFSSSCTVYGIPDSLPVSEQTPIKPANSPYGATKQMAETILNDVCRTGSLRSVLLRYFNPVGAHPSAKIGELPIGIPNNLVPFITQTAAGIRKSLSIYGGDYDTADGTAIRDYIHVVDLAKAHVKAIELLTNETEFQIETINVGTGNGYSVLEAVKAFESSTGVKLNYQIVERRAGDVPAVFADTTYANKRLNWKCEFGINEMMLHAWNWQKNLK